MGDMVRAVPDGQPRAEQLAAEWAGKLKLVKVDVDAARQTAARFSVQAVPTLIVIAGGTVLARRAGAAPVAALRTWLDQALAPQPGTT